MPLPKKIALCVAAVLVVFGAIWGTGAWFFSTHLFPGTHIGSTDLSFEDPAAAHEEIDRFLANYSLHVAGEGFEATLTSQQLGMVPNTLLANSTVFRGSALLWPFELLRSHAISGNDAATVDDYALAFSVATAVNQFNSTAEMPKDPQLVYNDKTNKVEVSGGTYGTALDVNRVIAQVSTGVNQLADKVTLDQSSLMAPSSTEARAGMDKAAEAVNKDYQIKATIKLGSSATLPLTTADALQWLDISDDFKVTYNADKYNAWLAHLLAQCNTLGAQRTYTRPDGKVCTVEGGDYGWTIAEDQLRSAIDEAISKKTGDFQVDCALEGNGFRGANGPDWGRYVDVDITEQHARFYDENDNIIWETDVITGYDDGTYDTPTGVYDINRKESPSVLQSSLTEIIDGEEVTITFRHDVDFWMPFISNFIGFHDAQWQDAGWGGDLYHDQRYGSGGCVNLPLDKATELYELIRLGDVVSVHF